MTAELERDILDAPGYDDPFSEVDVEKVESIRERMREDMDALAAREKFLGTAGQATIIDVTDKKAAYVFDVLLPDGNVGEIVFTGPEFSDAPLYDFLEFAGGERDDPFSVLYEDMPVTFCEWKGWRVPTRENTALGAYTGEGRAAKWFDIDEKSGGVMASATVRTEYRLGALVTGLVAGGLQFSLGGVDSAVGAFLVISLVVWGFAGYMAAAMSGMCQPKMQTVSSADE